MPLSWVFAIELKTDDTITLHVRINGFAPSIPVEISGFVTQSNGAVATFYDIQNMPATAGDADMDVINVQAASGKFDPELPFTVITRAADVWISKLTKNESFSASTEGIQAAWNSSGDAYRSALVTKNNCVAARAVASVLATPAPAGGVLRNVSGHTSATTCISRLPSMQ